MRCHRFLLASVLAMLSATCWLAPACGEQVIRLGGVRNVTATLFKSDETYRITVEMLPVKAFDLATNKSLNLSKGRMYVAQALGKHLKASSLTIRGLEIQESGTNGKFFRLVVMVPRDGIVVTAKGAITVEVQHKGADTPSRPPVVASTSVRHEIRLTADATTADFLNRKADYLDTIMRLQEAMCEEGRSLEEQSLKPEDFYDSIGSVEERSEAAFKSLAKQIDDDNLLSELLEREELRPALKKARAEVLVSLKTAVERFDQRQEKMRKENEKAK